MNTKNTLPWVLALVAFAAVGFLFVNGKDKEADLLRLRFENLELPVLRTAAEEARKATQSSEQILNTKEREELIRLRNEVGQLRREKLQLAAQLKQLQQTQQQALDQQQVQQVQLQQQNQQIAAQAAKMPADQSRNVCINNLRQIDGAKQQWALENKQPADALVVPQQIAAYFKDATLPTCPSGGTYTINNLNQPPSCSHSEHALPP